MNSEKDFMHEAIRLSFEAMRKGGGGPFGAVVVKDKKIIAQGGNSVSTLNDPTAHAEIIAIREACKVLNTFQLNGCEIYSSCEPCPMCLGAIYWARLDKVYFANTKEDAGKIGFDDAFFYKEINLPKLERQLPAEQICREEAMKAFEEWMNKPDKIKY